VTQQTQQQATTSNLIISELTHAPAQLIRRMRAGDALKAEEGQTLLGFFTASAGRDMEAAHKRATRAMIKLHTIHEYKLWQFSDYKTFGSFLKEWCTHYQQSTSTAWYCMNAIRMWAQFDREPTELLEIQGGVNAVRPLLEGQNAIVAEYARDGTVTALKDEWETKLREDYPDAESLHDLVRRYAEELIHAEATGRTVRSEIKQDKRGMAVDRFEFRPVIQDGELYDIYWKFTPASGRIPKDGYGVKTMNKYPRVRAAFCKMCGHGWKGE